MKKINTILLLINSILVSQSSLVANTWQDLFNEVTKITQKIPQTTSPRNKSEQNKGGLENINFDREHAKKLAHNTIIRAAESANLSMSAIKNATLHLNNIQKIDRVVAYLNNIISKRGNSIEQVEKAKQLLHEILVEAHKLEKTSHEVSQHVEKTLRTTTKLAQRLGSTHGTLPSKIAEIWDSIKDTARQNIPGQ